MKILIVFILIITSVFSTKAQTETRYYANSKLKKEVSAKKAKFSQTITQSNDGKVTTEVKNLKTNEIICRTVFKGEEPYGIWIIQTKNGTEELDYDFELIYDEEFCGKINLDKTTSLGTDSPYKLTELTTGEKTVSEFMTKYTRYPKFALENNIQGKVYLAFKVNITGEITYIAVKKGVNILLDKEAVRVLRMIKFSGAATFEGVPAIICFKIPITFKLY